MDGKYFDECSDIVSTHYFERNVADYIFSFVLPEPIEGNEVRVESSFVVTSFKKGNKDYIRLDCICFKDIAEPKPLLAEIGVVILIT